MRCVKTKQNSYSCTKVMQTMLLKKYRWCSMQQWCYWMCIEEFTFSFRQCRRQQVAKDKILPAHFCRPSQCVSLSVASAFLQRQKVLTPSLVTAPKFDGATWHHSPIGDRRLLCSLSSHVRNASLVNFIFRNWFNKFMDAGNRNASILSQARPCQRSNP